MSRAITITGTMDAVAHCRSLIFRTITPWKEQADMAQQGDNIWHQSSITIPVPSERVGLIIGKGGSTIKQLKEKTGAQIFIPQETPVGSATRDITISGNPGQVEQAQKLLQYFLTPIPTQPPGIGGASEQKQPIRVPEGAVSVPMNIPNSMVGLIIGRGGETLRDLEARSGGQLYIPKENNTSRGEREVILTGLPDQINHLKMLIQQKIQSASEEDGSTFGRPMRSRFVAPMGPSMYPQQATGFAPQPSFHMSPPFSGQHGVPPPVMPYPVGLPGNIMYGAPMLSLMPADDPSQFHAIGNPAPEL